MANPGQLPINTLANATSRADAEQHKPIRHRQSRTHEVDTHPKDRVKTKPHRIPASPICFGKGNNRFGIRLTPTSDLEEQVSNQQPLRSSGRQAVYPALTINDALITQIDPLRRQLTAFACCQPGCHALQRPYGVGWLCAAIIWAELGDRRRFRAPRTGGCGVAYFVDYGLDVPGNGQSNADYIVIHDYCADGHGVKALVWFQGIYLGSKHNGDGLAGDPVIWNPFPSGNVGAGDLIGLKVCHRGWQQRPDTFQCVERSHVSVDS